MNGGQVTRLGCRVLVPMSAWENKDLLLLCFCVQCGSCSQAELLHLNIQVMYMLNFTLKVIPSLMLSAFVRLC